MKKLLLITAILALSGCVNGPHFDFEDAKTVRVGDTEKQLMEKMDTPPYSIETSSCCEQWTWITGGGGMASFPLVDGKVVKIPRFPSDQ